MALVYGTLMVTVTGLDLMVFPPPVTESRNVNRVVTPTGGEEAEILTIPVEQAFLNG